MSKRKKNKLKATWLRIKVSFFSWLEKGDFCASHSLPGMRGGKVTRNLLCKIRPGDSVHVHVAVKNIIEVLLYFQKYLRWFETVFRFPFQLNFMKGLLICSKRLLLLVDSRCYNNLSTYQLLYSHWNFGCHGNLTGPQIHPISSI